MTGLPSASAGSEFKLFTDSVVIPDKLYWGGNLQYSVVGAQDPLAHGQSVFSAQLLSSTALTWQASSSLYFRRRTALVPAFRRLDALPRNRPRALSRPHDAMENHR